MEPNAIHKTENRVEVTRLDPDESGDARYRIDISRGPTFEVHTLNIGGRAAAFPGGTLELGGGTSTIIVKILPDGRPVEGGLLGAIGFGAEAIL